MKKTKAQTVDMIVNLVDIQSTDDIQYRFIEGKALAGKKLTKQEIEFLVNYGKTQMLEAQNDFLKECVKNVTIIEDDKLADDIIKMVDKKLNKKQPWYKRLWNWIRRK